VNQRLYRSREDRVLGGVAGGGADYLRTDPSIVRVLWAILIVFSGGLFLLLYIVMWVVVPEEPYDWNGAYVPPPAPGLPPVPGAAPGGTPPGTPGFVAGPPAGAEGPPPAATEGEVAAAPPEAVADANAIPPAAAQPAGGWVPPSASAPWPAAAPFDPRAAREAERAARHARRAAMRAQRREDRGASGAIIFGLILVLVGAFFLVEMYVPSVDAGRLWPGVLVIVGAVLLIGSIRPGQGTPKS